MFKKLIEKISLIISRVIFSFIPEEFKNRDHELDQKLRSDLIEETLVNFKAHFKKSMLFYDEWKLREYAIKTSLLNDKNKEFYYLEFGVWKGSTANFFSKYVKKLYVFDSFQGLKEDWVGTSVTKGTFDLKKEIPKLENNVVPIAGWIQDTLPPFLKEKNPKINFVHMDVDTYESSKFILEKIKPHLVKGAIILFDELYNFEGWDVGEYKALTEVFNENEYKFISFSTDTAQAAIKILN